MTDGRVRNDLRHQRDLVTGWNLEVDRDGNPDEAKQRKCRKCGKHFEAF